MSCDDVIYAIEGMNNGSNILKSVEKYDCAADKWIYVSERYQHYMERYQHSACVMQGKIFAVGGWNGNVKPV